MSASGKVTIVPDVARVQLGVTIARPTVKAARNAGAKAMTDILATIKSLGIADADVQTTNVSLYPQYGNGAPAKVVGYQISEQVQVTVRDLDKTGDVIDGATAHGADRRQRDLVRAGLSGQGAERRPCRGRRGGPRQRRGDGDRRSCLARCRRV